MLKIKPVWLWALLCFALTHSFAQPVNPPVERALNFPTGLLEKIQARTATLNRQMTDQTFSYLQRMQRREEKLRKRLFAVDSNAARQLFAGSSRQYVSLQEKISRDTGNKNTTLNGAYIPYIDSLQGTLDFLQKNPTLTNNAAAQGALSQFQALQAKMRDADEVKTYIQQRKQQISEYISQHANFKNLLSKQYAGMNRDIYYYSQEIRQFREIWNHPDQLEQKALALLDKLPAFQTFMRSNSQLAGLFNLPQNYNASQALAGLQTKDQVAQQIQDQVAAGGQGGAAALQSNMQSAESQLDNYKSKLSKLGAGNGEMDLPDFKPNDQKTKTFWKRLEYGANFQTTHNNYYFPTVTDLGLSLGYRLGHSNMAGIGASYKVGWGNGIRHVALSSQGVGLRSFLEMRIKGSLSATAGFEYNFTTPITSYQQLKQIQDWSKSGLIGISKTVSMKSRVFKKTKVQLLWDFLSYQQIPRKQPLLFRVGYAWN